MLNSEDTQEMNWIQGREISALLNPRPAVLVTSCDKHGVPNVLTIAWHAYISHDPPLLAISVAPGRYSHQLIKETRQFAVNIVDTSFQKAVEICGSYSGRDLDKFSAAGLSLLPAHTITSPLIAGALAHLECVVENEVQAGDHTLFIGLVQYAEARKSGFTGHWTTDGGQVLLCLQRERFVTWA